MQPVDHSVASWEDAVELAHRWRAAGTFTWFRGQSHPWPLTSSLGRQDAAGTIEHVWRRIAQFSDWVKDVEALRYLLEEDHVHELYAVLQHYGIPTKYVDFTTEPDIAGFFAAHGQGAIRGDQGCIIAIDPDDFVELTRDIARVQGVAPENWPEKVSVDVPDLWRMQAQSGHFIYLPVSEIENWYPYDRILFPHDGLKHSIAPERIYPPRKSSLERMLDQFFQSESMREGARYFETVTQEWKDRGYEYTDLNLGAEEIEKHVEPGSQRHPSWHAADPRWAVPPTQTYNSAVGSDQAITVDISPKRHDDLETEVRRAVEETRVSWPDLRSMACEWRAIVNGQPSPLSSRLIERAWDGMRLLPYSDAQLIATIVSIVLTPERLVLVGGQHGGGTTDMVQLELADVGGSTARAIVDGAQVRAAYRDDLETVLSDPELLESPQKLLSVFRDPRWVFDFDALCQVFATEVIPAQVVRNGMVVFFSPASVSTLGIA